MTGSTLLAPAAERRTVAFSRYSWAVFAAIAVAMALAALARWLSALRFDGPIVYGEGAVVHAGLLLARGLDPYAPPPGGTFVGANYPPLAYLVVALGSGLAEFLPLRAVNIVAALAIAAAVAWRARASRATALALASSFLALFPVLSWAPVARVDMLAVALTAFAVLVAGPAWRRALAAGGLAALALYAKPTALLPLAVVLLYLAWRERRTATRVALGFVTASAVLVAFTGARFDLPGIVTHVIRWNALPFAPNIAALLLLLGVATLGAFALLGLRSVDGRMRAYLVGAVLVVVLGGREGATVNYLLDVAAASCLALASGVRAHAPLVPLTLAAQLAVGLVMLATGALQPADVTAARRQVALTEGLPRGATVLSEDSGVLIANGTEPVVDDLFLWSRLVASGAIPDEVTPRVRQGAFAFIIADVPLDALDRAAEFERLRWPPALVRAVLDGYRLEVVAPSHFRYVPRRVQ